MSVKIYSDNASNPWTAVLSSKDDGSVVINSGTYDMEWHKVVSANNVPNLKNILSVLGAVSPKNGADSDDVIDMQRQLYGDGKVVRPYKEIEKLLDDHDIPAKDDFWGSESSK